MKNAVPVYSGCSIAIDRTVYCVVQYYSALLYLATFPHTPV
jgi:hypothetical protein